MVNHFIVYGKYCHTSILCKHLHLPHSPSMISSALTFNIFHNPYLQTKHLTIQWQGPLIQGTLPKTLHKSTCARKNSETIYSLFLAYLSAGVDISLLQTRSLGILSNLKSTVLSSLEDTTVQCRITFLTDLGYSTFSESRAEAE